MPSLDDQIRTGHDHITGQQSARHAQVVLQWVASVQLTTNKTMKGMTQLGRLFNLQPPISPVDIPQQVMAMPHLAQALVGFTNPLMGNHTITLGSDQGALRGHSGVTWGALRVRSGWEKLGGPLRELGEGQRQLSAQWVHLRIPTCP